MRTVEWDNGTVKLIDQRLLPNEFKIVTFSDVRGVATSIREMYVRGAPAIGATAAFGMALAAHTSPAASVEALRQDLEAGGGNPAQDTPHGSKPLLGHRPHAAAERARPSWVPQTQSVLP